MNDKAKAEEEPKRVIRYTGDSDRRIITQADLATLGVKSDHDLVWDRSNKKMISTEGLSKATVEAVAKQTGFELV